MMSSDYWFTFTTTHIAAPQTQREALHRINAYLNYLCDPDVFSFPFDLYGLQLRDENVDELLAFIIRDNVHRKISSFNLMGNNLYRLPPLLYKFENLETVFYDRKPRFVKENFYFNRSLVSSLIVRGTKVIDMTRAKSFSNY